MSSEYKHTRSCTLLRCVERLIYVGDNIVNLLDANGLEHTICVNACRFLFLCQQPALGRR